MSGMTDAPTDFCPKRGAGAARLRNPSDVQREGRIESYRRAVAEGRTPYWQDDWGAPPAPEADG